MSVGILRVLSMTELAHPENAGTAPADHHGDLGELVAGPPDDLPEPHTVGWGRICGWCNIPLPPQRTGRPRKYCTHTCRQHAYLQRKTNRAADWVTNRQTVINRLRQRLHWLSDEWGHELHHPTMDTATQLRRLYDDIWDVANRPARDIRGTYTMITIPRHPKPTHRDIGDDTRFRPRTRPPYPHLSTFPFAALYHHAQAEARTEPAFGGSRRR